MVPISAIELAVLSPAESLVQMQTVLAHRLAFFYVFLHRRLNRQYIFLLVKLSAFLYMAFSTSTILSPKLFFLTSNYWSRMRCPVRIRYFCN